MTPAQIANTRAKLVELKQEYVRSENDPVDNPQLRESSLQALRYWINKLTEDLLRAGEKEPAFAPGKSPSPHRPPPAKVE